MPEPALLTVIGCRAGMPADGWPSSCYLLDTGGQRLLFDCGPGAATALTRLVEAHSTTAVFLSHRHLDHCLDLVVLGKQLLYAGPRSRVPLFVPAGTGPILRAMNHLLPVGDVPELPIDNVFDVAFELIEYHAGQTITCGDLVVTPAAMHHRIPSFGFRVVTADGVFCYSGDTGPTDAFDVLAAGADLLLVEATLDQTDTTGHGHLSAAEAGLAAQRAGVRSLVLTHLTSADPAWIAAQRTAAGRHFAGPIYVATPGAQFLVTQADGQPSTAP